MTMPRPQAANRPKEVDASFWLWISAFVVSLLGTFFSYQQIKEIQAEAIRQALAENPELDQTAFESITTAAFSVGLVLGLLFLAVQIVFVFLMRGGRNWARIVMAVLGGLSLLFGLIGLLSFSGPMLVTGLLQFLLLIGAIVTMFLPAANAWFRPRQPGF
ncbi:MAG: hypothetical protein ACRDRA_16290 [Pseudonocardiaceae bacterium]